MKNFINKYQLSKTLRFQLIPQGKTLEHIQNKGLISKDQERAKSYQKMKETIDGFHKYFIELAMEHVELTQLDAFCNLYFAPAEKKKDEAFKKELEKVQTALRKEIAKGFQTGRAKEIFAKIDKKELITEELEKWISGQQKQDIYFDESFKNFTTYFGGFHENRKNMYSDKEQSTAIAYRLIHENLPKFLDNIRIFERIKTIPELYEKCNTLYQEIEEYLNIRTIDEAFELEYFNKVLTQKQIDVYNLIIGGRSPKEGEKKKGLNEYINLYNQQQKDKNQRIPKLKILYKQILSDRESTSFVAEKFENSKEVLNAINHFYHHELISFQPQGKEDTENVLEELQQILEVLKEYDLSKIYIRNDKSLTNISQAVFVDWGIIKDALEFQYKTNEPYKATKKSPNPTEAYFKGLEKYLKQPYFSIAEIEHALFAYRNETDELKDLKEGDLPIANYFNTHFKAAKKDDNAKEFDFISNITEKYRCIKGILENYPEDKVLYQEKTDIGNVKLFLDAMMELLHFVKPLILTKDSTLEKDDRFYGQFNIWYEQLSPLTKLYDKVRNFATQKPYSTEKFKLNFDNSTLLDGWDVNKEEANSAILFKKENLFYLGIMDKNHNKIFREIPKEKSEINYSKINYKLLPGASKMLPKVFFSAKNIAYYEPSPEILNIRNHSSHTKGGNPQEGYEKADFNVLDCRKMIDFFKSSIEKHPEWKNFGFQFSDTKNYNSIDEFYREVEAQGYSISYTDIPEAYINQLVDEGKLYLFQIYNKDFSPYSKGTPNMHTMYWKALFDEENLKDVIYKLNGQAEIFYRESIKNDKKTIHPKRIKIAKKIFKNSDNTTERVADEIIKRLNEFYQGKIKEKYLTDDEKKYVDNYSLFNEEKNRRNIDIVKDKRFTVDQFQFHVPITLNFKATGGDFINQDVLTYLKNNPDVNIIGIDRGERHLIYISLIDQKGNILKQETLNSIVSEKYNIETPYHTLLAQKEEERDKARKNWGTIENIKELKEGYLSQVVHKIAKMMVEHNAIVVMEDLNFGFKRGRFKVEKQVYQKLEKMLIDKLNYLVFKDKATDELGGLYKALQLTSKFTSFKDLGKQSGFLFYVPAWNTSKIDPTTGFVNLFNTKYENAEKAQKFFENFKSIRFNADKNYFEFAFDYNDFTTRAEGTKTDWIVCTNGKRILTFRNPEANNQWDNKEIILTDALQSLFDKNNIEYRSGENIAHRIVERTDKDFLKPLLDLFKLTLQMRNSISKSEIDYLISPVINSTGVFYDSNEADSTLPKDADANGAYHIAKKGLWMLEQINNFDGDDWKKLKLAISNKAWLNFVQQKS